MSFCTKCGAQMPDGAKFCTACGAQNVTAAPATPVAPVQPTVAAVPMGKSDFTGGAFALYFIDLLSTIVSLFTLGLAYPAMACWKLRWKAKHTYINGKRLVFDGKGGQLFGKYIIWWLLSIVTLGVYAVLVMPVRLEQWEKSHTHFEGQTGESHFDGTVWGMFGTKLLTGFVTVITLGIGSWWAYCKMQRWYREHQVVDGYRLRFEGTAGDYFCKTFIWGLLSSITFGIYSFWVPVKTEKWIVSHTVIAA